jgi:archaellum component FlaG (FlaF/FlaG flagellin family)
MVICLKIPITFCIYGRTTSLSYRMYIRSVMLGTEIHTDEQLVHDPRSFEVETTTTTLKRYKSPCNDQIKSFKILEEHVHSIFEAKE